MNKGKPNWTVLLLFKTSYAVFATSMISENSYMDYPFMTHPFLIGTLNSLCRS